MAGIVTDAAAAAGNLLPNGSLSTAAQNVIKYFNGLKGKGIVSGQFIETGEPENSTMGALTRLQAQTGQHVGMIGIDYWHFNTGGPALTRAANADAIAHWKAGGLTTLSLSMPNPTSGGGVQDGSWVNANDLLRPGTATNNALNDMLVQVGAGLKELQEAGVPVLFRPYHEHNGDWFWFGADNLSATQMKDLWKYTHDFMTNDMGLDNLVWVYSVTTGVTMQGRSITDTYPGDQYVDITGQDLYSNNPRDGQRTYEALRALGKPVAMTEFGSGTPSLGNSNFSMPDLINDIKATMPETVYWVQWWSGNGGRTGWGMELNQNTGQALNDPFVVNRGEIGITPGSGSPGTPNQPPVQASPDHTVVKVGETTAIVDAAGNKWTVTADGKVAVNGTPDQTTARVLRLAYEGGKVWQENADHLWWSKSSPSDRWGPDPGTSTSPISPGSGTPPTEPQQPSNPISPDHTVINAGSTAAIVDAAGNKWTITAGGQIAVNGATDQTTGRVLRIAYEGGKIWQENADHLWWGKAKPTDQWGPDAGTSTSPLTTQPPVNPNPPVDPKPPASGTVIGSGSDTIVIKVSSDPDGPAGNAARWAQFTVNVDGKQVGGLLTADVDRSSGQTKTFTLKGNFGPGAHDVTVTFANNSMTQGDKAAFNTGGDRNLYVNSLTYNGVVVSSTVKGIYESPLYPPESPDGVLHPGNAVFKVTDTTAIPAGAPPNATVTPAAVNFGSGPDKLSLKMAEDPYGSAHARFTVSVDGKQVGGIFTTTAVQWMGQSQEFNLLGNFGAGKHTVAVRFVNDAAQLNNNGMGIDHLDRNLYVQGVTLNGKAAAGVPYELPTNTSRNFSVTAGPRMTQPPVNPDPPTPVDPSISLTRPNGEEIEISGDTVGTVKLSGDIIKLTAPGVAQITIGAQSTKLEFIGMSQVKLTEGTGSTVVTADGGKNTWTAGKGMLDVTGGSGADAFVYHAGDGKLIIGGFSAAQGDTLTIAKSLQPSMVTSSDGHGGTMLSFGSAAGSINLEGVSAIPAAIRWS